MEWVDTHAHLNDKRFRSSIRKVIDSASAAGVRRILVIGIDVESSARALELSQEHPELYAVVGIQPNSAAEMTDHHFESIENLASRPRVAAIGETGMDRYWDSTPLPIQREYFVRHLELARGQSMPVVIHCREAEADVVEVLREFADSTGGPISGVMHSFSGDMATAKACWELGLHLSFAGMATYKANAGLREVAAAVPSDQILVETDSPYLTPAPLRGKSNEPAFVVHTGACLAAERGTTVAEFAALTTANAERLFRLPPAAEGPPRTPQS